MRRIADECKRNQRELAQLETLNMGKPLSESMLDLDDVAGCFEYYAGIYIYVTY